MKTITRLILRRMAGSCDAPVAEGEGDASSPGSVGQSNGWLVVSRDGASQLPNCPLSGRWIRRAGCVASLALLLATGLAHASSDSSAMDAANNAFAKGRYSEAARGYETIIAQRGYSAPVLFNLANAQQRDGQLGSAILSYERAALLQPNDPDIAANLRVARQRAGVEAEPQSLVSKAARTLTMNTWFGLAAVALFLFAVSWPLKLRQPHARRALNLGSVLAAVVLAVAVGALGLRSAELRRAVVVVPDAVAGVSPVTVAEPMFKLRAGEFVTLQRTHGDFAQVRNHAGLEGWVRLEAVTLILSPSKLPKG